MWTRPGQTWRGESGQPRNRCGTRFASAPTRGSQADLPPEPAHDVEARGRRHSERLDARALGALYEEYWAGFSELVARSRLGLRPPTPSTRNYARLSLRSSDMRMNAFASVRDRLVGVELVLRHPACDDAISRLKTARGEIEQALGRRLEWNEYPGSLRIALSERGYDLQNRGDWARQHDWLIEKIRAYQETLLKRIDVR